MQELKIENLITEIRNSNPVIVEIFTHGSCFNFYHILKSQFPNAECYYDQIKGHVITKIDRFFYDITGKVDVGNAVPITHIWSDKYKCETTFKIQSMYISKNKPKYIRK